MRPASIWISMVVSSTVAWSSLASAVEPGSSPSPANPPSFTVATDRTVDEADAERHRHFENASRRSGDLRLRILFSRKLVLRERDYRFEDVIPLSDLLEAARGSTDPIVLQLLLDRCRNELKPPERCDAVELARRWTIADAQNQIAWIELAAVLDRTGDSQGADDAWTRAGDASTFRDGYFPVIRIVVHAMPVDPHPRQRHADLMFALASSGVAVSNWGWDATKGCRNEARRAACAKIAETAWRDADNLMTLNVAQALARRSSMPADVVASRELARRASHWALFQRAAMFDIDAMNTDDPAALGAANHALEQFFARGEAATARDTLREMRLSDEEGARRYEQSLKEPGVRTKGAATR